jgi:transposase
LLPPSLSDWLPEDHLAWFVLDCVEEMDLDPFYAKYREDGWGGAAHHPKTMVALLVYAYCLGGRSSRQIERACHVDVAFRVICAGLFFDHTTIARFRQRHEEALKTIFTASLRLCAKVEMTSVGLVALDGMKMAAPASMRKNRTKDAIDEEVDKMFADAKAIDAAEDAQFGERKARVLKVPLQGRPVTAPTGSARHLGLSPDLALPNSNAASHSSGDLGVAPRAGVAREPAPPRSGIEPDQPRVGRDAVGAFLHRFFNVVLWMNGHRHVNEIALRPSPLAGGGAFVDVAPARSRTGRPKLARSSWSPTGTAPSGSKVAPRIATWRCSWRRLPDPPEPVSIFAAVHAACA